MFFGAASATGLPQPRIARWPRCPVFNSPLAQLSCLQHRPPWANCCCRLSACLSVCPCAYLSACVSAPAGVGGFLVSTTVVMYTVYVTLREDHTADEGDNAVGPWEKLKVRGSWED